MKSPLISKPGFFLSAHLLLTYDRFISGSAYLSHTLDFRHRHDLFYRYGAFLLHVHHCGRYNSLFIYAKTLIYYLFLYFARCISGFSGENLRRNSYNIFVRITGDVFFLFPWEQAIWSLAREKGREHVRDNCEATPTLRWNSLSIERYERCFFYQTERELSRRRSRDDFSEMETENVISREIVFERLRISIKFSITRNLPMRLLPRTFDYEFFDPVTKASFFSSRF